MLNPDLVLSEISDKNILVGTFDKNGNIITTQINRDSDEYESIRLWRKDFSLNTNSQTVFRFAPSGFSENTRVAALEEKTTQLSDEDLVTFLTNAGKNQIFGSDGQLIFDFSLEDYPTDFARLPSGEISLTEISKEVLLEDLQKYFSVFVERDEALEFSELSLPPMAVETRLRTIMRDTLENSDISNNLVKEETVALLIFTIEGAGFAFWNSERGFFLEIGENFNIDYWNIEVPDGANREDYVGQIYGERLVSFLNEHFYNCIFPEDTNTKPINLKKVIWTATSDVFEPIAKILDSFGTGMGIEFDLLPKNFEEIILRGLLLGINENTTEKVASINLKNDLVLQAEAIEDEINAKQELKNQGKRQLAMVFLFLPILLVCGVVVGLFMTNFMTTSLLENREEKAQAEKQRLQAILVERSESEKTRAWFESIIRQIVELRKKQPTALSFSAKLETMFPQNSFFLEALELKPGGDFEIKGYSRNQLSVSEFAKAIEFASDEKEERYFGKLALDFKQGSNAKSNLPNGVSEFSIKGNYALAATIKAQTSQADKNVKPENTNSSPSSSPDKSANTNAK